LRLRRFLRNKRRKKDNVDASFSHRLEEYYQRYWRKREKRGDETLNLTKKTDTDTWIEGRGRLSFV